MLRAGRQQFTAAGRVECQNALHSVRRLSCTCAADPHLHAVEDLFCSGAVLGRPPHALLDQRRNGRRALLRHLCNGRTVSSVQEDWLLVTFRQCAIIARSDGNVLNRRHLLLQASTAEAEMAVQPTGSAPLGPTAAHGWAPARCRSPCRCRHSARIEEVADKAGCVTMHKKTQDRLILKEFHCR